MHYVEHSAIERHQRDQKKIRKGDARQLDREFALAGIMGEAGREEAHRLRHEHPCDDEEDHLRQQQKREHAVRKQLGLRLALLAMDMGIGRHEGGVESALGKDRAEMVGQAERDKERVRHGPGAKDCREHDVARETCQPRKQGVAANGEDAPKHAPLLSYRAAHQNGEIRLY